jgi:hypothetical protein
MRDNAKIIESDYKMYYSFTITPTLPSHANRERLRYKAQR